MVPNFFLNKIENDSDKTDVTHGQKFQRGEGSQFQWGKTHWKFFKEQKGFLVFSSPPKGVQF